jgi:hypothetical protein
MAQSVPILERGSVSKALAPDHFSGCFNYRLCPPLTPQTESLAPIIWKREEAAARSQQTYNIGALASITMAIASNRPSPVQFFPPPQTNAGIFNGDGSV